MPDISKIRTPNGTEYNIKDAVAREAIQGGVSWLGVTTTALTDGATVKTIKIGTKDVEVKNGDKAAYGNKEFVYSASENKWRELGDLTGLGALALKNDVSGSYTPEGTNSAPTFTGKKMTSTGKATPAGEVSAPTVTVTPKQETTYVASGEKSGGAVTPGTAAKATMPAFGMSVEDEALIVDWTDGTFEANTPTSVTLPSFVSKSVTTGIQKAEATAPTFTGNELELNVEGTPTGDVSAPVFTGKEKTFTAS